MADTRKDRRAPVSLKVRFKSATVDEFIEQYSKDVSRGGIFIKSSQPMAVGTLLKFQFQLKDESALIRGVGRVVWTRSEEDAGAERPAGMGIKFIKMDAESKATVERVLEAHEGTPGTYETGRSTASQAEADSLRPPENTVQPSGGGAFFPETTPMDQLPPPEDRTAVRHAAQFLASALSEAATDEAAAREAEQKGEEARKRQQQIEAERAAEAERRKKAAAQGDALPSIMIDPSLDASQAQAKPPSAPPEPARAPESEVPTAHSARPSRPADKATIKMAVPPPPTQPEPARAAAPTADTAPEEDTSITDRKGMAAAGVGSGPPEGAPEKKRSNLLSVVAATAVAIVAGFFLLRGRDESVAPIAVTPVQNEGAAMAPAPEEPQAPAPAVEPSAAEPGPALEVPEPAPSQPAEPAGAAPEPAPAQPAPAPEPAVEPAPAAPAQAKTGSVRVLSVPAGASVYVDGKHRGRTPTAFNFERGVPHTISARAKGHREASQVVTAGPVQGLVKLELTALPYIVHVETVPSGATVSAGGKRATAPADIQLVAPPKGPLAVSASLPGYQAGVGKVVPNQFTADGEIMRAQLTLTLSPVVKKPAPAPKPVPTTPAQDSAPKPAAPAPEPAAPEPAAPAPSAPAEAIPDNPFG